MMMSRHIMNRHYEFVATVQEDIRFINPLYFQLNGSNDRILPKGFFGLRNHLNVTWRMFDFQNKLGRFKGLKQGRLEFTTFVIWNKDLAS